MDQGEILWQVANGDGMARVENHPALKGVRMPPLGGGGRHPVLVTSTLLIHAQDTGYGPLLIARDKATGEELARIELSGSPQSAPMSFAVHGKQYIALTINSYPVPQLVAFSLPD
jgi:quinoprotein glucose dehydrogenase